MVAADQVSFGLRAQLGARLVAVKYARSLAGRPKPRVCQSTTVILVRSGIEQHVVQPVVAVQQGEPVGLGQQPRRHQSHGRGQRLPVLGDIRSPSFSMVMSAAIVARRPCPGGGRVVRFHHRDAGSQASVTPTGGVQPGDGDHRQPRLRGVHPAIWSPCSAGAMSASSSTKSAPSRSISQW